MTQKETTFWHYDMVCLRFSFFISKLWNWWLDKLYNNNESKLKVHHAPFLKWLNSDLIWSFLFCLFSRQRAFLKIGTRRPSYEADILATAASRSAISSNITGFRATFSSCSGSGFAKLPSTIFFSYNEFITCFHESWIDETWTFPMIFVVCFDMF